jgi:hypothetical protein
MSVPKEIRKLFNNLIVFKPSKIEFETLCEEIFEMNRDTAYTYTDVTLSASCGGIIYI